MDSTRLCPKCGAYWKCDCVVEASPPSATRLRSASRVHEARPPDDMLPTRQPCQHDWSEVVGVELDESAVMGEAQVLVCRHCGLYAVEKSA